jgi:hypothetical protein
LANIVSQRWRNIDADYKKELTYGPILRVDWDKIDLNENYDLVFKRLSLDVQLDISSCTMHHDDSELSELLKFWLHKHYISKPCDITRCHILLLLLDMT